MNNRTRTRQDQSQTGVLDRRGTVNSSVAASFQTAKSNNSGTAKSSITVGSCDKFGTARTKDLKPELCKWRKHIVSWHGDTAAAEGAVKARTLGDIVSADTVYPTAVLEALGIAVDPPTEAAIKRAYDDTPVAAGDEKNLRRVLRRATCAMAMAIVQYVHASCAEGAAGGTDNFGTANSDAFEVSQEAKLAMCVNKLNVFMQQQNTPMGFSKWLPWFLWRTAAVDSGAVRAHVLQSNLMTNILSVFLAANQAGVDVDAVVAQAVQRNALDRLSGIARKLVEFFIDKAPYVMQWRIVDSSICRAMNDGIGEAFNYFNVGYLEHQACDRLIAMKSGLLERKKKWEPKTRELAMQHMADVERLDVEIETLRTLKQEIEKYQREHRGETWLPAHLRLLFEQDQDPGRANVVEALLKEADATKTKDYIDVSKCQSALQMLGTEDVKLFKYVLRQGPQRGGSGGGLGDSMEVLADLVAGIEDLQLRESLRIAYTRAVFAANCMVLFGGDAPPQTGGDGGNSGSRDVGPELGREIQECVHMVAVDQLETATDEEQELRSLILDAMSGANAVRKGLKSQYDKILAWMRGAAQLVEKEKAQVQPAFRPTTTHTLCLLYNILCAVKYHGLADQFYAVYRTFIRLALEPGVRFGMTFAYAGGTQWWRDVPGSLMHQIAPEMKDMPKNDREAWFAEFYRRWNDQGYMLRVWRRFHKIISDYPDQGKTILKTVVQYVFTSKAFRAFLATVQMDNQSKGFAQGCDAFVDALVDTNPGIVQLILAGLDKEIAGNTPPQRQSGGSGAGLEEALVRACATVASYVAGPLTTESADRMYRFVNAASMVVTGVQLMDATGALQQYEAGIVSLCRSIVQGIDGKSTGAATGVPSVIKSGQGLRSIPMSSHVATPPPAVAVPVYGGGGSKRRAVPRKKAHNPVVV